MKTVMPMKPTMLIKLSNLYLLVFFILSLYYFVTVAYQPKVTQSQQNQVVWMYNVTVVTIMYVILMIFLGLMFRLFGASPKVTFYITMFLLVLFYIVYFSYLIQGSTIYDQSMIDTLVPEFKIMYIMFIVAFVLMAFVQIVTGHNVYKTLATGEK